MIRTTRNPCLGWLALLAALFTAAVVVACGGGGVDTGGTGAPVSAYASGRITGFGSIVVNGVHYDESGASIVDDAGQPRSANELQLGMTVDIEAGDISVDDRGRAHGVAARVQFGSHIAGPVESVDAAAGTLHVLGQTVDVDVNTVLDGFSELGSLGPSDLLQVFAFFDPASGRYAATRLELARSLDAYKLRGPIAQLDTGARTFAIGDALISYAAIDTALPQLANGVMARVELQAAPHAGPWVATRLQTSVPSLAQSAKAAIEGYVADFVSLADFKVNGVRVDASGMGVTFRKGSPSGVANGVRMEVQGRTQGGILLAETIVLKKTKPGSAATEEAESFVLEGRVGGPNPSGGSFSVRGVRVVFDDLTQFEGGTASSLDSGDSIVVTGRLENGTSVRAENIRFTP